jgi:transposase
VRSAVEWARVRALVADGNSEREIAKRLGIKRRTVRRLAGAGEPPRYERAGTGSMRDPLEAVICGVLKEWPAIKAPRVTEILREDYGYAGSVDLVRTRMATLRPREVRAAQRAAYWPGQVMQVDWAEMPTRPRIAGCERRVYALVCSLPCVVIPVGAGASVISKGSQRDAAAGWPVVAEDADDLAVDLAALGARTPRHPSRQSVSPTC